MNSLRRLILAGALLAAPFMTMPAMADASIPVADFLKHHSIPVFLPVTGW
jgi:Spy/CpxP family protein refolding chaperone